MEAKSSIPLMSALRAQIRSTRSLPDGKSVLSSQPIGICDWYGGFTTTKTGTHVLKDSVHAQVYNHSYKNVPM